MPCPAPLRAAILLLALAGPAHAQGRVLTLDAVRLRTHPSASAATVRTLEMATPLGVEGTSGRWRAVRSPEGARGWVRGDLVVAYDEADPLPGLRAVATRDAAREAAPFAARARLVNLLSAAAESARAPAARAELALLRLQALQRALDARARERPSAGWDARPLRDGRIRGDSTEIAYGEPQGQWYVRAERFWALRDRFRTLPIAERIAWAAATQTLPGECEADPTCMIGLAEAAMGRYLSLHPRGAHAPVALRELRTLLAFVEAETRARDTHARFCRRDGADYTVKPERLAALRATVQRVAGAERDAVARLVGQLIGRCS